MTPPRRAVIVDDERLARKRLRDLLKVHPGITVVGEADSVETAVPVIAEHRPDVVFLDVEMPPGNGFDLLPLLPDPPHTPEVVFVTAYENFALRAFEVSAIDYLLKPIHTERLALTVQRLLSSPRREDTGDDPGEEAWTMESRVTLSDRRIKSMVEISGIVAIQALGAYSRVSVAGQPPMIILRSISEWERRLPSAEFLRVDRSLIIQTGLLRKMKMVSRDETEISLEGMQGILAIGRVATLRLKKHVRDMG
ncbi:response regulator [Luteolibacter sp. SL250]|uniref:LytR/AlgR family response regulator transcription factor n=1 Tax=Luteolibacter sp. SL250 TaxID=2995170 RepID=UPI00226DF02C|nr:response regulator [Luteolibacter sp. SL250]WAC19121.1 response regulator [Luteolibacter sp. SL250]